MWERPEGSDRCKIVAAPLCRRAREHGDAAPWLQVPNASNAHCLSFPNRVKSGRERN
jgi:hypothetical protein